jgi:shikimate dehydrogenase
MSINKDTQLCISIAERPSNFGTTLHNMAYAALNLNFIYKAVAINDLAGAITGVRALGIRGCSVSMPFKQAVIPFLDELDETAKSTGAVNTIVNDDGHLTGHNTDLIGARIVLATLQPQPDERVLILGAGGVARAILVALRQLGCTHVSVANRNIEKVATLNTIMPCSALAWSAREQVPVQFLINATSVGMAPATELMPVETNFVQGVRAVMDVVVSPMESRLIACARASGKTVASGYQMSLEQAAAQFSLYTGHTAPRAVMEDGIRTLLAV